MNYMCTGMRLFMLIIIFQLKHMRLFYFVQYDTMMLF